MFYHFWFLWFYLVIGESLFDWLGVIKIMKQEIEFDGESLPVITYSTL